MKNPIWKKQRGTDFPALWDGESTWCLVMGAATRDGTVECHLSNYPPQVVRPSAKLHFEVMVDDRTAVRNVLTMLGETASHFAAAQKGLGLLEDVGVVSNMWLESRP